MEPEAGQIPTGSSALELWLAYPGDLAEPAAEAACAAILDDAERARAARFRFARHRREFLATHALTRVALSHAHPLPPHAWSFSVNQYGKPSPIPGPPRTGLGPWGGIPGPPRTGLGPWGGIPECGLRFNQSNSVELAVCLIARPEARPAALPRARSGVAAAEVGVDVESFARADGIVPLAVRVFSTAERAQLDALPAAERPSRALSLWTLKEAYIKARGMGLSLPLQGISFLFDGPNTESTRAGPEASRFENGPQTIRFEVAPGVDEDPQRWRFCRFDHAGHRIALAVEAAVAGAPEILEVRPPLGTPTRLAWGSPAWF